ncbi:SDR family oxidoreductase [Nocardia jinanensis]|uniref:3-oxoacyl-[acyl-carrier-protein] reductase MabA n=1 Tax=Nocardia jinanensis TaxID=382504 RepID=A0A917RLC8_9NOCA|nr:SDR family oxidoreductase [Nocardia jinanensis]GGL13503.1 3-oxoacyl-ACP reductase [Nocardia jinanensis]
MDFGIEDRVALVVGGSRGMGFEVAKMLAAEGSRVAIAARTAADVEAAVDRIRRQGGTAFGVTADCSDRDEVGRAVELVRREFGPPLIVIGQAKYQRPGDFADITDAAPLRESFEAYTVSQFYLLHAVLPGMREAGWGRFVHIGSATAKEPTGSIHHVVANATRPATVGLLKTVADEYARFGITINTVAPGWIETESAIQYLDAVVGAGSESERREFMLTKARVPAGRIGRPAEIASLVTYLCSADAGYVNGNWIEVDGGLHRSAF